MSLPPEFATDPAPSYNPTSRRDRWIIAGLVACLLATIVYTVVAQNDATTTIEAHLKTIALQTQQVEALDTLATRVDAFNREFGATVGRLQVDSIEGGVKALEKKGHLPDQAKKTLAEFEQSITDIQAMTDKMKDYERYLGAPVSATRGQTHADIARTYLIEQAHLSPKDATDVIKHTALDWDIEPGNKVFNLYHDGILLSTVTQGTARHSPLAVQGARRRAIEKKTQELEEKVKELESRPSSASTSLPEGGSAQGSNSN